MWRNGKIIQQEPDLTFPDKSVYEVIRILDGVPLFFEEHLKRLTQSLASQGYPLLYSNKDYYHAIQTVINERSCNCRIHVYKVHDQLFHEVFIVPHAYPTETMYQRGVNVVSANIIRDNPHVKVYKVSYIEHVSALKKQTGAYEIVLYDQEGKVTEGSRSNIFFIQGKTLITPCAKDVLLGISREKVIEVAKQHGFELEERDVYIHEIKEMEGAFLTGTSIHVLPIAFFDDIQFKINADTMVHHLLNMFKDKSYKNIDDLRRKYNMKDVKNRFLSYVTFDTQSCSEAETCPSSKGQYDFASVLKQEMIDIGVSNVFLDEHGYLYGEIPATKGYELTAAIGFIAHMDTSPDFSGANVKPQSIVNYDGGDIVLNQEKNIVMKVADFPALSHYKNQELIVTDGTTLLGADNKAGIAEILCMAEYLINHSEIDHGPVKIAFTPDEEIGRGADLFNVTYFGAEFAYTVDGGELGEIEFENFNAATAKIAIQGNNIHPGAAKGKMVNALLIAMELHQMLPVFENPAYTEKYEGFYHLNDLNGCVEQAKMLYIIRDHDRGRFENKKALLKRACDYINSKYAEQTVTLELTDSYYNMKEKVEPHYHLIEHAVGVMKALEIEPKIVPIRGGTDGARLSFMGLPCPNLCTGGHNFHGKFEFICVESMSKTVQILVELVKAYSTFKK